MANFNPQLRMIGNFNRDSVGEAIAADKKITIPKRKLLDYEIYYIVEGQGTVYFDDFSKTMKAGDLLLISPLHNHYHKFDFVKCYWMHLDLFYTPYREETYVVPAGYQISGNEYELAQPSLETLIGEDIRFIRKPQKDKKHYEKLFAKLVQLDQKGGLESEMEINRILLNLLEVLFRNNKKNEPSKTVDSRLEKVKRYLEANLNFKISLEEMASIAQLAPYYFAHKFKEKFGDSPYNYHLNCRIGSAARILLDREQNISEVSDAFGFDSVYNFSRVFKKVLGCSPSHYIKTHSD